MFFIGIFGVQKRMNVLREYDTIVCSDCGRWSRAQLREEYAYFHIFFIPIFKWDKRYTLYLRCCNALYDVNPIQAREMRVSDDIDLSKLRRISPMVNICPHCNTPLDPGFSFCPNCGTRL